MHNKLKRLVFFDIDNTLIQSSSGHIQALLECIKDVYGIEASINAINHHGMTDQEIIVLLLEKYGVDNGTIQLHLNACVECMPLKYAEIVKSEDIVMLGGVFELLASLDQNGFILGLVTGNLEKIARAKLKKIGINHFFKMGGFGSDHINRTELAKIAIQRAKDRFNIQPHSKTFLFGDTPSDIKAARAAGSTAVGVATGIYAAEQLQSAGADKVLQNLEDAEAILKFLMDFNEYDR